MKKNLIFTIAVVTIVLSITLIPNVFSQPENVQVLSFNWYISPMNNEYLIVVGEVQNVGPNVIDFVRVVGTFYAFDGTPLAGNSDRSIRMQILPQQKTPFYMLVSLYNSSSGELLDPQSIKNLTVSVATADPTDSRQYQDLEISSHSPTTDANGYYAVTGVVRNTGAQSPSQVSVIATFYDSAGSVVALGYYDLPQGSIAPGNIASFTIYPLDYDVVVSKIASYSLLIQASITTPSATPTPTPTPMPSGSSSPSPTPTETGNGTDISNTYVYVAVAIIIIVIVLGILALVARRKRVR